jgi:hypothetical protein
MGVGAFFRGVYDFYLLSKDLDLDFLIYVTCLSIDASCLVGLFPSLFGIFYKEV